jgi:hypothetical protein
MELQQYLAFEEHLLAGRNACFLAIQVHPQTPAFVW